MRFPVCYGVNMLRVGGCLLLAVTAASAQRLYVDATREELARAVPELAALQPASDPDKLDELLRVDSGARSELARLDEQEPEVIQKHRDIEVQRMPQ